MTRGTSYLFFQFIDYTLLKLDFSTYNYYFIKLINSINKMKPFHFVVSVKIVGLNFIHL